MRLNCLRSSIQHDGAVAGIDVKQSQSILSPENHDRLSDAVKSAHKNTVKKKSNTAKFTFKGCL